MSRESRMASRAGSRAGSRRESFSQGYSYELSNLASGYTTPSYYASNYQSRPDSAASNREIRAQLARNSQTYKENLCKGKFYPIKIIDTLLFVLELNVIENSDKRWEARFPLDEKFIGDPNSVKVFKRNSHIIIEKRIPIPSEVQQTTVSAYFKGSDIFIMEEQ